MSARRSALSLAQRLQSLCKSQNLQPIYRSVSLLNAAETPTSPSYNTNLTFKRWSHDSANPSSQQHSEHASGAESDNDDDENDMQQRVLDLALQHIQTLGWRKAAMEAAASELGLSPAIVGSFPRGEGHLVEEFNRQCNLRLKQELADREDELKEMRIRDRVALGIRMRLEMVLPLLDSWPDALAIQARPAEVLPTFHSYADIADIIWRAAGDTSADFNWYTKRGLVMGTYVASELFLISDSSPEYADTWKFLDRRIEDILVIGKNARSGAALVNSLVDALGGVLGGRRGPPPPGTAPPV